MLGEATLDVLGTFLGEAIRLLILSVAQQLNPPGLANALAHAPARYSRRGPSVGIETADMLVHEVLSRPMRDRSSRSDRRNAACLTSV